jgi:type III secretory pathway component EscV
MTFFTASIQTVVLRYYAMMAVIVITFAMGYPMLTFLGFPIFLAAITAVSFNKKTKKAIAQNNTLENKEIKMVNTAA